MQCGNFCVERGPSLDGAGLFFGDSRDPVLLKQSGLFECRGRTGALMDAFRMELGLKVRIRRASMVIASPGFLLLYFEFAESGDF